MLHLTPAQNAPKPIRIPKKDKEILDVMLEGLDIFNRSLEFFSESTWQKMNDDITCDDPVDCTWNQVKDLHDRLKEFAEKCEVKR